MNKKILVACILGITLIPSMGQSINLNGIVTDKTTGAKIAGATVKLLKAHASTLTDINGAYHLTSATGIGPNPISNGDSYDLKLNQNNLVLNVFTPADIRVTLHDLKGQRLATLFTGHVMAGKKTLEIPNRFRKQPSLFFKITPDKITSNKISGISGISLTQSARTARTVNSAAVPAIDTLQVTQLGYETFSQAIDMYTGNINVTLTSQGIGCAAATVCWTFETGELPVGSRAAQLPGQPARGPLPKVDKLHAHSGVYAMHLDSLVGQPMRDIEFDLPPNFGPVLWGRVYLYITPNGPMPVAPDPSAHGAFFKGLYTSPDTAGLYWYENGFDLGKYFQMQHIPEPPGYPEWTLYTNQIVSSSKWECVEWEMDGTLPSEPKLFIDGVEVAVIERKGWTLNYFFTDKPTTLYKKADNFKKFWLGLDMYHKIQDKTELWFDDLAVATKRVGCN